MPSVSQRQRRYLYATKGPDWVKRHHFDQVDTSRKKKKKRDPRGEVDAIIRKLKAG